MENVLHVHIIWLLIIVFVFCHAVVVIQKVDFIARLQAYL